MLKTTNRLLAEAESLRKENEALKQQLREAKESIGAMKKGDIDAVVFAGETDLKIYTESTADKIYRALVEKMNEGAVSLTKEGTILYCNSCFAKMVNLPLQKVTGLTFKKFIDKKAKLHIEVLLGQGGEKTLREEVYLNAKDGNKIPVLMTATTFVLDAVFVVIIILTDLTLQKKDQEELKLRTKQLREKNAALLFQNEEKEKREVQLTIINKELESFTYVSSHDLQEPLRKIQTLAGRILEKEHAVLSDTGKDYFNRMNNSAARMQTLIEDLLEYSQTSLIERKTGSTNLYKIVDEVKSELADGIGANGAVIEVGTLCDASINPFQFRQVVHNLMSNALKFSIPGVPVRINITSETADGAHFQAQNLKENLVKLTPAKSYCCLRFSDNGIGFDEQYKDKIFEVFQRLHGKAEYEGTGIGLAIVKKIVENHDGVITADSEVGKGATFSIYLPVE